MCSFFGMQLVFLQTNLVEFFDQEFLSSLPYGNGYSIKILLKMRCALVASEADFGKECFFVVAFLCSHTHLFSKLPAWVKVSRSCKITFYFQKVFQKDVGLLILFHRSPDKLIMPWNAECNGDGMTFLENFWELNWKLSPGSILLNSCKSWS